MWALEVPDAPSDATVRVLADDGSFKLRLERLGSSDLFAGAISLQSGTAFRWSYEVIQGERRTHLPHVTDEIAKRIRGRGRPFEVYATHPDSRARETCPRPPRIAREKWRSAIYKDTTRDWWVYVPAQYDRIHRRLRHGLPGRPRLQGLRPDRLRQPDRPGRHAGHRRRLHQSRRAATAASPTAASSTTPSPTSTPVPARRDPARGRARTYKLRQDAAEPGHLRHQQRRHLRLHRRLGAAGPFRKVLSRVGSFTNIRGGDVPTRPDPQDPTEADPRLPPGRRERPGQQARRLVAGQPHHGQRPRVRRLRLHHRLGQRLPYQQTRPRHPPRLPPLALARYGR